MKKFQAVIYCLLSLALSGFCIYKIIYSRNLEPSIKLHVTDNKVISFIIDMAIKFLDNVVDTTTKFGEHFQGFIILGMGIFSLLFYTLFADTMHGFFSQLPLGSIRKFDCFKKPQKGKVITPLLPSILIGLYTGIHSTLYHFFPEKLDFCVKWILPVTIILVSITFLALIISVILDGGLWGIIIRIPLIFTTNLCFSLLMGGLMMMAIFAVILVIINIFLIIATIIGCIFFPTTKTKTEIYYR